LPEEYRGKLLFSEWGKAALFVTEVARDGATFKLVKDTPLIESGKGVDFRPMQVNVAPDGSLLIADWGWGGWKASKREGTVWRLSWADAKPAPRLKDESKASVEELIAALGHPDRDQRLRAQNKLAETVGLEAKALRTAVNDFKLSKFGQIHALWAFVGRYSRSLAARTQEPLRLDTREFVLSVLKSADPQLRGQALRALTCYWGFPQPHQLAKDRQQEQFEPTSCY
jgi:hypothetical protein